MEASTSTSTPTAQGSPVAGSGSRREMRHEGLEELCGRRDAGEVLPSAPAPLDLSGLRLVETDLSGLDLSGVQLTGAELLGCDLRRSRFVSADLTGAVLHNCDLTNAELLGADLSGADLTNATLDQAGLGQITANETVFFGAACTGATFSGADLTASDFRAANLASSRMLNTVLNRADFANAKLNEVDLSAGQVDDAVFRDADLRGAQLRGLTGYKTSDWIDVDIQNVDFTGAWHVRRFIQDENYIHEFRTQSRHHELLYRAWSITSDCGRSLTRWSIWTVLVAMIYAGLYNFVEIDWGEHETPISPVYYSVVTFTTLGYGDVLPGSTAAQLLAMSEVVLGYFSLGGMMSILSDKMARRAG